MSKTKLLSLAVIGLLVINLGILAFLLLGRAGTPRHPSQMNERDEPKRIIIHKLQLDDAQVTEYEKMIAQHRASIRGIEGEIRDTKNEFYLTLAGKPGADKDSLQSRLGMLQQQIEATHYDHFVAIRTLCKPQQLPQFNELTSELAALFGRNANPPPPRDH